MTEMPVVSRGSMEGMADAFSGATLERVELADGRRLVLKHLPPGGDWLTRLSGRTDRARQLWESGLLDRLAPVVDHTVVDVLRADDHDVVIMRDAGDELLPLDIPVSRSTSRRLLAGLVALHDAGRTEPGQALCPIGARYRMTAPDIVANDLGPAANRARDFILAGWEIFCDDVDADLTAAVFAVHRQPDVLGRRLAGFEPTLLHGDPKLENLGLGPRGLVAVDWGDLTGFGPAEVDVAWYAVMNTWRIGGSPGDVFADYGAAARVPLRLEALDLACIGSLAQMGFKMAHRRARSDEPGMRRSAAHQLAWWTGRVRTALDRVGPL